MSNQFGLEWKVHGGSVQEWNEVLQNNHKQSVDEYLRNGDFSWIFACCWELALWKARHSEDTPESKSHASFPNRDFLSLIYYLKWLKWKRMSNNDFLYSISNPPIITVACSPFSDSVDSKDGRDFNHVAKLVLISVICIYFITIYFSVHHENQI